MSAKKTVVAYKGFDLALKCRDHQFEVGKTYSHEGNVEACKSGFHACEYPLDVFEYYAPAQSRYAIVEQSGILAHHERDSKIASSIITIKAELSLRGLIKAAIEYTFARAQKVKGSTSRGVGKCASSTGVRGAASSTGYQGAASSTGDYGAASSTGYQGAASSTGDRGAASSTGDYGAASSTGIQGAASSTGIQGAAMASGYEGRVMGAEGNALFLVERDTNYNIVAVWAAIVGRDGIKPHVWYVLKNGKPVEVTP